MGDSVSLHEHRRTRGVPRYSYHDLLPFVALVRVELVRTLRLTRSIVFLSLFLIVASGVALFNWPTGEFSWNITGSAARGFLAAISMVLWMGAALSIPALAGNSVVQERERRTLDMLATTLATPALFVFAKLINSVGFAAILCVSMAPILVLPIFLVGVDPWAPFAVVLLVLATSLATASLGIWSSLRCRRSATAVACSYGLMLVLQGAPVYLLFILLALMTNFSFSVSGQVEYMLHVLLPAVSLTEFIEGRVLAFRVHPIYTATVVHFCVAVAVTYFSIRRARKLWGGSQSTVYAAPRSKTQTKPIARSSTFYQALNPVMLKDLRFTLCLAGRNGIRIACYTFLVCGSATAILLYMKATNNWTNFSRGVEGWMLLRAAFMPLLAVAFCVPLVHNEKTYRTLDALRCTLLTPTEILRGKLLAMAAVCGAFVAAAFAADLPHLMHRFNGDHEGVMLLTGAGTLIACMLLAISTSVIAAVFLKDRNTALAVSMIALFCLLIGNYWFFLYMDPHFYGFIDYFPRGVAHWDVQLSPLVALFNQADSVRYNRTHFTTWTTTMLLYTVISAALIAVSFRGYRKRMS